MREPPPNAGPLPRNDGPPDDGGPPADPPGPERASARELVRRRRGAYRAPDTGRHHHIGAAPDRQPLLGPGDVADGVPRYVEAAAVQLAQRTMAQLALQRDRLAERMATAAVELDFEQAARLRDDLAAVDAELFRRA